LLPCRGKTPLLATSDSIVQTLSLNKTDMMSGIT
jgi:hypothetical protein